VETRLTEQIESPCEAEVGRRPAEGDRRVVDRKRRRLIEAECRCPGNSEVERDD